MAIDLPRRVLLKTGDGVIRNDASLAHYDATWGTKLRETWIPALRGTGEPDEQWDWFGKADDPCFDAGLEHVVLACDGDLQGTLITSLPQDAPALSRLPAVVYIEYLSSAPWNRGRGGAPRRFKLCAQVLLRHAVLRSVEVGRRGAIGLHSERDPRTVAYYQDSLGLQCRGDDPAQEDRPYFEGDAEWAARFLK